MQASEDLVLELDSLRLGLSRHSFLIIREERRGEMNLQYKPDSQGVGESLLNAIVMF